jgi:Ca2+-binding EF-hand superfamily protein
MFETTELKENMKNLFKKLDINNDNKISLDELKIGYNQFFERHKTEQEIEKLFFDVDTDNAGALDYDEFI